MLGTIDRVIRDAQDIREALSAYSFVPDSSQEFDTTDDEPRRVRHQYWSRGSRRITLETDADTDKPLRLIGGYAIQRPEFIEISFE
jgi:hypothetical protein